MMTILYPVIVLGLIAPYIQGACSPSSYPSIDSFKYSHSRQSQYIALTFEGPINVSSVRVLDMISGSVPKTWFISECSRSDPKLIQKLAQDGVEIGISVGSNVNDIKDTISCLSNANVTKIQGVRGPSTPELLSAIKAANLSYSSSLIPKTDNRVFPFSLADGICDRANNFKLQSDIDGAWDGIHEIPMSAPTPADDVPTWIRNFRESFTLNYIYRRAPVTIAVSRLIALAGQPTAQLLLNQLVAFSEVVPITAGQLNAISRSTSNQQTIAILTTNTPAHLVTHSPASTDAPKGSTDAPTGTTTAPNGTTNTPNGATNAPNGATDAPHDATDAPHDATDAPHDATDAPHEATDAPTGDDAPGNTKLPTDTRATAAPLVNTNSPAPTTAVPRTNPNATTAPTDAPSASAGYIPYLIGSGGVVCCIFAFVFWRVYNREDRFPPLVAGDYALNPEDRDVFDLESRIDTRLGSDLEISIDNSLEPIQELSTDDLSHTRFH